MEQARVLFDEEKKRFGKRKRVGFSNAIWFGNAHLGCRENKHDNDVSSVDVREHALQVVR